MFSTTATVPYNLCFLLPQGIPCPQPFPNFPVPVTFGYATGVGDQEGCAAVPGFETQFCHNILQPSYGAGEMVPTQQAEQKEKNLILEQVERGRRRRDPLKRKSDALLELGSSHRDLLAALETPVFDSKRLRLPKGRRSSSPESPVELGQELPNHKVLVDRLLNRNSVVSRFLFDLKAQLASTITSACPSCREDETPWIGQLLMLYALIWESVNNGNGGGHPWLHWAGFRGCYPAECSKIEMATNSLLLGQKYGLQDEENSIFLHARPIAWAWNNPETDGSPGCTNDQRYNGEWKSASYVAVTTFAILVLALTVGTAYDIFNRARSEEAKKKKGEPNRILTAFSLLQNFEFVVSTKKMGSDRIDCIEGIRAISMTWVVMGHSFLYARNYMFSRNAYFFQAGLFTETGMAMLALTEAPYSVDTFFFIGATLVSYLLLKDLDKTNGWLNKKGFVHMVFFYFNRLLRIGLPYGLFILFMIGVPPLMIRSPLSAAQYVQDEAQYCINDWQDHLMYTNNFPEPSGCVGQSWFLGTDMWFFFASPIIVYPLWLSKFGRPQKMAAYLWWLLFPILSIACQLRCLIGATDTGDTEKYCFMDIATSLDFAPWGHRNQCYIMGLLCGYVLHFTKGRTIKIPPVVNLMLWQFFLAGFFAVIYAPYNTELEGYETPLQRFWYSCSNLMWGICLFWLIFACCRGYGGPINDLLSWGGWSPIAKVSFMTYLVHMDFNYWFFFSQDYAWDYNLLTNVSMFLGNLAVALSFGLLFCIGMELPLAKLQKIIIGAYVTRMTKGQKWTLPIFLTFIAVILFLVANALAKLWKKDLVGDLGLRVSEW